MSQTKLPYLRTLLRHVPEGGSLLDYGCGIGSDGLLLAGVGYEVAFADFDNPSTAYLSWRLRRRGLKASVYDLGAEVPGGFDAAFAFDVIEHVEDPFELLAQLEARAGIVAVNLLEDDGNDTSLHRSLPIRALTGHAARRGLLSYTRHHRGRSHLLVYAPARDGGPLARARAHARAWRGRLGQPAWAERARAGSASPE